MTVEFKKKTAFCLRRALQKGVSLMVALEDGSRMSMVDFVKTDSRESAVDWGRDVRVIQVRNGTPFLSRIEYNW
jgi:hypothetical protein